MSYERREDNEWGSVFIEVVALCIEASRFVEFEANEVVSSMSSKRFDEMTESSFGSLMGTPLRNVEPSKSSSFAVLGWSAAKQFEDEYCEESVFVGGIGLSRKFN